MKRIKKYLAALLKDREGQVIEIVGAEVHLKAILEGSRVLSPKEALEIQKLSPDLDVDLLVALSRDDNVDYKKEQKTTDEATRTSKSPMHRSALPRDRHNF